MANAPTTPCQAEYWNPFGANATLAPGEVYVVCHSSAHANITAKCNHTNNYLSNGDDGWCLSKGSGLTDLSLIDCTHEGI